LNDSGPGSLRQAIFEANNIFNPDTIQFDPGLSGAINLTSELLIRDSVTIIGPGAANVTIKSNGATRVMSVFASIGQNQFTVFISGLTITGGNAGTGMGGGIFSNGTLTLSSCQIIGNQSSNGGGIACFFGNLILKGCSVTGNLSNGTGGGLLHDGLSLTINNSTFSGNAASDAGGGAFIDARGSCSLTNVTITKNSSGSLGGGFQGSGFVVPRLRNCLVAGNSAATSGPDANGAVDSQGHNLFQNTNGILMQGDPTGNLLNVDPQLGPLANNGGPTLTHALLPTSPAINAGDNADAPEFDQRGAPFRRVVGGTIDIGAFEFDHPPSIDSGPTATPSVVDVGQPVQFSAAASDADNDVLAFAWNFGDGSSGTGSSVSHVYNSAGNFTATLTVSDANAVSSSGSVSVQVLNLPLVGAGFDTDGDGFSDSFEVKAGTDPADINSNPLGAPVTALLKLNVSKLNIKLNFAKKGSDTISLSGNVPVPAGYSTAGKKLTVSIGDLVTVFTLDARGKATQSSGSAVISIKAKKGVAAAQTVKFAIKLNKGNFGDQLAAVGLVNTNVKNLQTTVPVDVILSNDGVFAKEQAVVYSAASGKGGTAK
jgi:PKD repeat protein